MRSKGDKDRLWNGKIWQRIDKVSIQNNELCAKISKLLVQKWLSWVYRTHWLLGSTLSFVNWKLFFFIFPILSK